MGRPNMRIHHSRVVPTLVLLAIGACFSGTGSGLTGTTGGNGGGSNTPPVLGSSAQPNSPTVGQTIPPPVEVAARDSLAKVNSAFTGAITIGFAPTPPART